MLIIRLVVVDGMGQNRTHGVADDRSGERGLRDTIDEYRLAGLACVLVGVSQLPLAFIHAESNASLFVVGAGGWMLIGIGINLLQGRRAFEIRWTDNGTISWLIAAMLVVFAVLVFLAAGLSITAT